jgi:hypothetical protein
VKKKGLAKETTKVLDYGLEPAALEDDDEDGLQKMTHSNESN